MILLPTYNRIEKLTAFMKSAIKAKTSTPGLVLIDREDYIANEKAYLKLEAEEFPYTFKIHVTESRGMGAKVREVWKRVRDCNFVGILNDDHIIITEEWDKKLTRRLNGKNFVSCNDRWCAPARAAGATFWSMPLLECVGWPIFPPQIEHLGIDDIWELIGRATGCWTVDMSIIIEHSHVLKGALNDETHKLTYGEGSWDNSPMQQDVAMRVQLFKELEFPQVLERVKAFIKTDYFGNPLTR